MGIWVRVFCKHTVANATPEAAIDALTAYAIGHLHKVSRV
jgi:hypothetical protein